MGNANRIMALVGIAYAYFSFADWFIVYKSSDETFPFTKRWNKRQGQIQAPQRVTEAMATKTRQLSLNVWVDFDDSSCLSLVSSGNEWASWPAVLTPSIAAPIR